MYYNREQKEQDKALVQLHTDLALVLQVLLHASLDTFRTPNFEISPKQLREECQWSTKYLCTMLFEYFGKHTVQTSS